MTMTVKITDLNENKRNQSASEVKFLPLVRYSHFQNSRVERGIQIPWAKTTSEPRGLPSLQELQYAHVYEGKLSSHLILFSFW
jgi:hypothetical protein